MIGIEITYKDGSRDWYDPVDEAEFDRDSNEGGYNITVGEHRYAVDRGVVASVRLYSLCEECGEELGECGHGRGGGREKSGEK